MDLLDATANPFSSPDIRLDGLMENALTGMGTERDKSQATIVSRAGTLSVAELEELYCNAIIQRVVDVLPDRAGQKSPVLTLGGDEGDAKIIQKFATELDRLEVVDLFVQASIQARIYGGAAIVLGVNDGKPAFEPVDLKKIESVRILDVLDRHDIYPMVENQKNPMRSETYQISWGGDALEREISSIVHSSRILRFDGVCRPPKMLLRNNGWGGSVINQVWDEFRGYYTALASLEGQIGDYSVFILKIKNLLAILASGSEKDAERLAARLKLVRQQAGNNGGVALDSEEDLNWATRSFNGIEPIVGVLRDAFIGASGIPHTELFGESPSGLGATGESEQKGLAAAVSDFQSKHWKNPLRKLFKYLLLSKTGVTKGKLPDVFGVEFPSILQETQLDILNAQQAQAQVDTTYIQYEVLAAEEVRQSRFGGSSYAHETNLDDEAWEASKEGAQQQAAPPFDFGNFQEEEPEEELETEQPETEEEPRQDSLYSDRFTQLAQLEARERFQVPTSAYARRWIDRRRRELQKQARRAA